MCVYDLFHVILQGRKEIREDARSNPLGWHERCLELNKAIGAVVNQPVTVRDKRLLISFPCLQKHSVVVALLHGVWGYT